MRRGSAILTAALLLWGATAFAAKIEECDAVVFPRYEPSGRGSSLVQKSSLRWRNYLVRGDEHRLRIQRDGKDVAVWWQDHHGFLLGYGVSPVLAGQNLVPRIWSLATDFQLKIWDPREQWKHELWKLPEVPRSFGVNLGAPVAASYLPEEQIGVVVFARGRVGVFDKSLGVWGEFLSIKRWEGFEVSRVELEPLPWPKAVRLVLWGRDGGIPYARVLTAPDRWSDFSFENPLANRGSQFRASTEAFLKWAKAKNITSRKQAFEAILSGQGGNDWLRGLFVLPDLLGFRRSQAGYVKALSATSLNWREDPVLYDLFWRLRYEDL